MATTASRAPPARPLEAARRMARSLAGAPNTGTSSRNRHSRPPPSDVLPVPSASRSPRVLLVLPKSTPTPRIKVELYAGGRWAFSEELLKKFGAEATDAGWLKEAALPRPAPFPLRARRVGLSTCTAEVGKSGEEYTVATRVEDKTAGLTIPRAIKDASRSLLAIS